MPIPLEHLSDRELLILTATQVNTLSNEVPIITNRVGNLERRLENLEAAERERWRAKIMAYLGGGGMAGASVMAIAKIAAMLDAMFKIKR